MGKKCVGSVKTRDLRFLLRFDGELVVQWPGGANMRILAFGFQHLDS